MVKQCKQAGLPEPEFVSNRGYELRAILGRDIFTENILLKRGLSQRQLQVIKYVKEKGEITSEEYQKLNSIKRRLSSYELSDLVKKKVFIRIGKVGKGTYYQLSRYY